MPRSLSAPPSLRGLADPAVGRAQTQPPVPAGILFQGASTRPAVRAGSILCLLIIVLLLPASAAAPDDAVQQATPGDPPEDPDRPAVLPAISPNATPGFFLREYRYRFEGSNITIRANVSASLYYGAQNGIKYALAPENATPESMAGDYYRSFEHDPALDGLYTDLRDQFRAVQQVHRYSDDEYLELMSTFVQGLPYDTSTGLHPDTTARFPAETIV